MEPQQALEFVQKLIQNYVNRQDPGIAELVAHQASAALEIIKAEMNKQAKK